MTNVVVVKQKKIIVTSATAQQAVDSNVTIKNTVAYAPENFRLDRLKDVIEGTPEDGYTLVYDKTTDKYVVSPTNVQDVSLDGGEF